MGGRTQWMRRRMKEKREEWMERRRSKRRKGGKEIKGKIREGRKKRGWACIILM